MESGAMDGNYFGNAFRVLGQSYGKTKMAIWWWLSVPYSIALPLLSLILGLRNWAVTHILGLFVLVAYVTVLSSLLWAISAAVRTAWRTVNDRLRLGAVPLMVLLWIVVFKS